MLWAICFIEGMCKIQGTFECMSNIQLWMSPTRDFTVFFPVLHIIIIGSMQLSDLLAVYLMYHFHWSYMHLLVSGFMMVDLLILTTCIRHFRTFKKLPLFGIDWLGGILWAVLALEITYLFNYGEFYDWWNSPVIRPVELGYRGYIDSLPMAHVHNTTSVLGTANVDVPQSFSGSDFDYVSGNVFCHRTCIGTRIP